MIKKVMITVTSCLECPYCSVGYKLLADECFHRGRKHETISTVIPDTVDIPDWCPLENYEEK